MITELKNIVTILKEISKNPFFKNCANGDHRLMAALCLYFNLSYQFDFANYATMVAIRTYENDDNQNLTQDSRECIVLFNLEHAILSYSACYDKILQIVYFAFHFAKEFSTKKEYQSQLNRCRWHTKDIDANGTQKESGLKFWFREIESKSAQDLLKKLEDFYGSNRGKINKYANQIKHKGGISIPILNNYIPSICTIESPFKMERDGNRLFPKFQDSTIKLFKPDILYPIEVDPNNIISLLIEQNSIIYDFSDYLFKFMGLDVYDANSIFAPNLQLPFYYNGTK